MKKWTFIDKAATPDGGEIALYERDGDYFIRINGQELMSTRKHASEEALATQACQAFSKKRKVRLLIGGLGCGFTLRAALASLGKEAHVVVAELIPAVVAWNKNPAYPLAAKSLTDPRAEVVVADVAQVIRSRPSGFDAILLDVDNGPNGLCIASNNKLYTKAGLASAKAALRPDGCLGIWSSQADPAFAKFMERSGFKVEIQRAPGSSHTLFLGRINDAIKPRGHG